MMPSKSYRKNVVWPNLGVGSSFHILDIRKYACGLKLGSALTLSQNPIFEIAFSFQPQMALLHDFGVGRHDLNPQNSSLFLRFKSDTRLELAQNPSSVIENLSNIKPGSFGRFRQRWTL